MQPAVMFLHLFLLSFGTNPAPVMLDAPPSPDGLPKNIWVQPELRATVGRLWDGSRTFRKQVDVIGRHRHYHVAVVIDPQSTMSPTARAQCTMRAFSSGIVIARVSLPDVTPDAPELVAHEFEHILERIEGIDLRGSARAARPGYFEVSQGRIETARAIRVGRQALAELQTPTLLTQRERSALTHRERTAGLRAALTHE